MPTVTPVKTAKKPAKSRSAKPSGGAKPDRAVRFDKLDATFFLSEEGNFITAAYARELLGWRVTKEREEAQFTDIAGNLIACDHNLGNREFDQKVALGKTFDILNRQWADSRNVLPDDNEPMSINGQVAAVINRYGEVEDGQKTLAAVVFAEQVWEGLGTLGGKQKQHWRDLWPEAPNIEGIIVFGTSPNSRVKRTLDNTQTRDFQDVLYTSGYFGDKGRADRSKLTRTLSYAIRFLWKRVWGNLDSFNPCHTNATLFGLLDRHGGKTGKLVQAVEHIHQEDVFPKDRNGELIPNAKRKLSRYLSPGTSAALLYLMGSVKTVRDDYINASPPSETQLDWDLWDRAVQFWTALAKGGADFREVRDAISGLVDPDGGTGGSNYERIAILIKAWHRWAENHKIREQDVKLTEDMYKVETDQEGNVYSRRLVVHPPVGGIDAGEPDDEEPGKSVDPSETDLPDGPEGGVTTNGDDPAEERRLREELDSKDADRAAEKQRKKGAKKSQVKAPADGATTADQPPVDQQAETVAQSLDEQLNDLRTQHPGKLLLFKRAGSYCAWQEDAKVLSDLLKTPSKEQSGVTCAEFPAKNLAGNLLKLVSAGHQVALCEHVNGETVVTDYDAPAE